MSRQKQEDLLVAPCVYFLDLSRDAMVVLPALVLLDAVASATEDD